MDAPDPQPSTASSSSAAASLGRGVGAAFPRRFVTPLLVGSALNPINSSLIATALVSIAMALHVSVGRTAILVSVLYLASAVAQPAAGRLSEVIGPRRVFLVGLLLILVAGVIGGLGSSLALLIVSRAVLGIGTSTAYPSAMVLISQRAHRNGLTDPPGNVLAGLAIAAQVTAAVGPAVGGLLLSAFGWRVVFLLNVPLALITLAMAITWIPKDDNKSVPSLSELARRVDATGMALFTAMMITLLVFVMGLPHLRWIPAAACLACATVLTGFELRASGPFIDIRLLVHNTRLTRTYLRSGLALLSAYIVLYGFTQWLETARGLSAGTSGLLLVPLGASAALIARPVSRRNLVRGPLIAAALALLATGAVVLIVTSHSAIWLLILVTLLVGIALGASTVANQTALYAQAPPDAVGTASGLLRTAGYIGSIASASIIAIVFKTSVTDAGLHHIALIMIAVAIIVTVFTVADRRL